MMSGFGKVSSEFPLVMMTRLTVSERNKKDIEILSIRELCAPLVFSFALISSPSLIAQPHRDERNSLFTQSATCRGKPREQEGGKQKLENTVWIDNERMNVSLPSLRS